MELHQCLFNLHAIWVNLFLVLLLILFNLFHHTDYTVQRIGRYVVYTRESFELSVVEELQDAVYCDWLEFNVDICHFQVN
jgi:hypothetical protein